MTKTAEIESHDCPDVWGSTVLNVASQRFITISVCFEKIGEIHCFRPLWRVPGKYCVLRIRAKKMLKTAGAWRCKSDVFLDSAGLNLWLENITGPLNFLLNQIWMDFFHHFEIQIGSVGTKSEGTVTHYWRDKSSHRVKVLDSKLKQVSSWKRERVPITNK